MRDTPCRFLLFLCLAPLTSGSLSQDGEILHIDLKQCTVQDSSIGDLWVDSRIKGPAEVVVRSGGEQIEEYYYYDLSVILARKSLVLAAIGVPPPGTDGAPVFLGTNIHGLDVEGVQKALGPPVGIAKKGDLEQLVYRMQRCCVLVDVSRIDRTVVGVDLIDYSAIPLVLEEDDIVGLCKVDGGKMQ